MPNWCYQTLVVTGDKRERDKFLKGIKGKDAQYYDPHPMKRSGERWVTGPAQEASLDGGAMEDFCFHKIIPIPLQVLQAGFDGHNRTEREQMEWPDGYTWQCEHWGTKWGPCELNINRGRGYDTIHYETAWAPARPIVIKLIETYPELGFQLHYTEESEAFEGDLWGANGQVTTDEEWEPEHEEEEEEAVAMGPHAISDASVNNLKNFPKKKKKG